MKKFADVILPLPIKALTYRIPSIYQNRIDVGSAVLVPLRSGKLLLAIVMRYHDTTPAYPTKELLAVVYQTPLFTPQQCAFLEWIANYYLSSLGETLAMALPKLLNFPNNLIFQINGPIDQNLGSAMEQSIVTSLQYQPLSYASITQLVGKKEASKALISLLSKSLVKAVAAIAMDQVDDCCYITLSPTIHLDPLTIANLCPRSPKQQALLSYFLPNQGRSTLYISKKALLGYSKSAFHLLFKKGILIQADPIESSIFTAPLKPLAILTAAQQKAMVAMQEQFAKKEVVLLHGAIGSGKTELYMHLIQSILLQQKQVLLLVPEIGLVTHIVERIRPFWGEWLIVHHSKQSHKERLKTWSRLLNQSTLVVVGTRSALLLPFKQLQLIIIDEEHDHAYKQTDVMPTYHARDSSILLAKQHQAKVLLGSGTPSIESYYNAQSGKYGLVTLQHRFGAASSPKLSFIDLNIEKQRKAMRDNFSLTLLSKLEESIMRGGQAMIFQNRRGYARYLLCESCGWIPRCLACAVSLTYHQEANQLCCHYCGHAVPPFWSCNSCGSGQLHNIGFGTEKLEETLQLIFPAQKMGRMDLDSTKGKNGYQSILEAVTSGSMDILVGTQMMAKGLDFPNITFVGILDIDGLLYFPDFRSNEKCFQLITQLAGRAGRRNQQGNVFIQTRQPDYPLLRYLADGDYEGMYRSELLERKKFVYPPYVRLIKLSLSCIEAAILHSGSVEIKKALAKKFEGMVLGPQQPLVGKVKHRFLLDLFFKIPSNNLHRLENAKTALRTVCKEVLAPYKTIKILWDIDPI